MSFWCWGWWCETVLLVLRRQKRRHWICTKRRFAPDKNIKKERKKKHSDLGWCLCTIDFCGRICVGIFWVSILLFLGLNIIGSLFLCVHDQDEFGIGIWSFECEIYEFMGLWVYGFLILLLLFKDPRSPFI